MQESQYRHRRVVCQELSSAQAPQVFVCLVGIIFVSQRQNFSPGTPTRRNKWLSGERGEEENQTLLRLTSRSLDDDISIMTRNHFLHIQKIYIIKIQSYLILRA